MPELRDLLDPAVIERLEVKAQAVLTDVTEATPATVLADPKAETRAAIEAQRNVEAIRRTRAAKQRPRTTDDQEHPVVVTTKETRMKIDLSQISDAELGAIVRERMMMTEAERLESRRQAALRDQARAQAAQAGLLAQSQEERKGHVLPAFSTSGVTVPALDLSDVTSLDEPPSSAMRSPYNKARFRLLKQDALDPEETTYRVLEAEHLRLSALAAQVKPKQVEPTATVVDVTTQTKAQVLAEVKGITVEAALEIIASL